MSKIEFEKWTEQNGTKTEYEYFNGIRYALVTMNDGWIAVFERRETEYIPMIQAADIEHARGFCSLRERPNVPFNVI